MQRRYFLVLLNMLSLVLSLGFIASANAEDLTPTPTVTVGVYGDYQTIQDALNANETDIQVLDGVYEVSTEIKVLNPDTKIVGSSRDRVTVRQTNPDADLLVVRADRAYVSGITFDASSAQAALVVADSNYSTIENSAFLGSTKAFTVYFAGKSTVEGQATLDDYYVSNMDTGNTFRNNEVVSYWQNDVLSFSLQKDGTLSNNTVIGGKIAFYMNRNSSCVGNEVTNSQSTGIEISIPSADSVISDNVISSPRGSGIRVLAQIEHPMDSSVRGNNVTIASNQITDPLYFGIEIDKLDNSVIENNVVSNAAWEGVYLLRADGLTVRGNRITETGALKDVSPWYWHDYLISGIFLDYQAQNSLVSGNEIENLSPTATYAIRLQGDEIFGNTITQNTIRGLYGAGDEYRISGALAGNEVYDNNLSSPSTTFETALEPTFLTTGTKSSSFSTQSDETLSSEPVTTSEMLYEEWQETLEREDAYHFEDGQRPLLKTEVQ